MGDPSEGPGVSVTYVVPRPGSSTTRPGGMWAKGMYTALRSSWRGENTTCLLVDAAKVR